MKLPTYKNFITATFFAVILSGCATSYTNKELRDIFSAKGLKTEETERGVVVFLPNVFFEFDKADLTPEAQAKVGDIAVVTTDPRAIERKLLIEGHTDSNGSDEYNLNLSSRRADTVYQGLLAGKVAASRMTSRGFGEKYPIAADLNPDGSPNLENQAKNRRVEVVVANPEVKN